MTIALRRPGCPAGGQRLAVSAVCDVEDRHASLLVVDAVDDAVGAPRGAVPILEWGLDPLADSLRIVRECAHDELVRGEGDGLRQMLRQLASRRGSDDEGVAGLSVVHARCRRRSFMAWASLQLRVRESRRSVSRPRMHVPRHAIVSGAHPRAAPADLLGEHHRL